MYKSGAGSQRPESRSKVTLLKELLLNTSIISTLDYLSRDSKAGFQAVE